MHQVRFYFDFISPYSWLALAQAGDVARRSAISWQLRPVVYARLLDAHGLLGPGETPARRRAMFADVARCALRLGQALKGPPAHPFRSLEALRTAVLFLDDPRALELCLALAHAAWAEGKDLTHLDVLQRIVADQGLEAQDLGTRLRRTEVKEKLRVITEEAVTRQVFGVPTFVYREELFWGHDRLEHLEDVVSGRLPALAQQLDAMLARPRGADRRVIRNRSRR